MYTKYVRYLKYVTNIITNNRFDSLRRFDLRFIIKKLSGGWVNHNNRFLLHTMLQAGYSLKLYKKLFQSHNVLYANIAS